MKAVERHLYIRKGYYYYRSGIPRNLRPILPLNEFVIALGTQDLSVARVQSVQLDYEITQKIRLLQQNLSGLLPDQSPDNVIHSFLSEIEKIKISFGYQVPYSFDHSKWGERKNSKNNKFLFSHAVQKYLDDCPSDSHSTRFQKEATYRLFQQLMGDLPLNDIGINEAREFKTLLQKIPSNAKKQYDIESFENVDLDKLKGKPQHPKTINNRLAYIVAMFNWAIRTGYYHGQNPFFNLMIKIKKNGEERRHPFKPEELKALFHSDLYKNYHQNSMIWVPLIGLYTGMRLNEICQLYVSDIKKEKGIYIFDVNDDGQDKALKNPSSRRRVPIHKELIRKGFLDYVDEQVNMGETRLFPDIPRGASAKSYSSTFTKRFWRLLLALKIKRQGLCFHSLRHTFIDGMRNAGVERSIVMALTGHQSSKEVHDSYGYGYNLSILQKGINKLSFPEVEK